VPYAKKKDRQAYWKKWYRENRQHHIAKSKVNEKRRQKRIRRVLQKLKQETACAGCGHRYPYWIMQFDHVPNRGEKIGDISTMVVEGYSLETILAEAKKCDITCANCHADRTHKRRIRKRRGTLMDHG
jgi:hypothetical protein